MESTTQKFKEYTWKSGTILFWILNPGTAFNEIILGQRIPKVGLEDISSDKPRIERLYVPCPHCETIHDGRTWSTESGTAFRNWFGLYCPSCTRIIPCLWSAFSLFILTITFPLWGFFRNSLKEKWLEKQPQRYENISPEDNTNPYSDKNWVKSGLSFAVLMFILMTFILPLLINEEITWLTVGLGLIIWPIGGLAFGYWMKIYFGKKGGEVV